MTVSTINNVTADAQRALDKQNRQADTAAGKPVPQSATLPVDSVADSALRSENVNRETAIQLTEAQNREAAEATLSDEDIASLADQSPQEKVLAQAKEALSAQTNKLPANVLSLLVE